MPHPQPTLRALATLPLLWLALQAPDARAAEEAAPRYTLKQQEPDTGTLIKRNLFTGNLVPFDKAYAELTPEQQLAVKAQYEQMGPDDEPPYPVEGPRQMMLAIHRILQSYGAKGSISMGVEVGPQGDARSVSVLRSPNPDMTRLIASVLMLQKYKPARCGGSPCTMAFPLRIQSE